MKKALVIYHGGCNDGLTAAAIASSWYDYVGYDVKVHPAKHGDPFPRIDGYDEVCIVDFSYPLDVMSGALDDMAALSILEDRHDVGSIVLIDHHQTAEPLRQLVETHKNFVPYIEMSRSGALLAWEFFAGHQARDSSTSIASAPALVQAVSRRDMWQHERGDDNDALFLRMSSGGMDVKDVQRLLALDQFTFGEACSSTSASVGWKAEATRQYDEAVAAGRSMTTYRDALIKESAKNYYDVALTDPNGRTTRVRLAQAAYALGSDTAYELIQGMTHVEEGERVAGYWYLATDRLVQIGLRSDGFDVAEVAQGFGGGGHRKASGLRMDWGNFCLQMSDIDLSVF